jgi:hypothetical protein
VEDAGNNFGSGGDAGGTGNEGTSSGEEGSTSSAMTQGNDATTGVVTSASDDTMGLDGTDTGGNDDTAGDSSESGGQLLVCEDPGACQGAVNLGNVSGDRDSPTLTTSGSQPAWIRFRVTEDDHDIGGEDLKFTATLSSPAEVDFDLYVYRGPEGGTTGCGGTLESSTLVGADDSVSMEWGEGGGLANGDEDAAWIAVEIRSPGGMCDPAASWELTIAGDT